MNVPPPQAQNSFLLRRSSARQLGLRMKEEDDTPEAGEKEVVAFGRLEPLQEGGKPSPPLADGATDNDDSGSTSGDSCALPSLAVWQQTQAASRASMLRVESTLAALTEALGKVKAQQQASAERTESGMAALASTNIMCF